MEVMKKLKFRVELTYDFEYSGYVADCSNLPGCMSQGKSKEAALRNIREAIRGYLHVAKEKGMRIPSETLEERYITVPASSI